MTKRPYGHPFPYRLVAGVLGLAIVFTGTAVPVAAAEPSALTPETAPHAPAIAEEGTGLPASVDMTPSPAASPDPSPAANPDPSPAADPDPSPTPSPAASSSPSPIPPMATTAEVTATPSPMPAPSTVAAAPVTVADAAGAASVGPLQGVNVSAGASGGTSVAGQLTGDVHWTLAGSPYLFTDNVSLAAGATLKIDPGVTVDGAGLALTMAGVVRAHGTPSDPILVTRVAKPTFTTGSAGSSFSWTEFRGNGFLGPMSSHPATLPALSHVWFNGGSGLHITDPMAGQFQPPAPAYSFADARFTNGAMISTSSITWSAARVSVEGDYVEGTNSKFSISDSNLIRASSGVCTLTARSRCALTANYSGGSASATNVWWGATDYATINTMVWDYLDDPAMPRVALAPVRTAAIDLVGPTAKIDDVTAVPTSGASLSGTAMDAALGSSGVASVGVSLGDLDAGTWWDGTAWSGSETFLPAAGTSTWTFAMPSLLDGHGFVARVQAIDGAGNEQWGAAAATFVADGTAPSGTIKIIDNEGFSTTGLVQVATAAIDVGAGVDRMAYSLDGTNWTEVAWTGDGDREVDLVAGPGGSDLQGTRTVWAKWRDAARQWSAVASDTTTLDTIAPEGTITLDELSTTGIVGMAFVAHDAGTGVDRMAYSVDGQATWQAFSWTGDGTRAVVVTHPGEGEGYMTVWAKWHDAAGNWSAVVSGDTQIDMAAPDGNIKLDDDEGWTAGPLMTVSEGSWFWEAGTGYSTTSVSFDRQHWYTSPRGTRSYAVDITKMDGLNPTPGAKTLWYRFTDIAGNTSEARSAAFRYDPSASHGSVQIEGGASAVNSRDVTLSITVNPGVGAVRALRISNGDGNWTEVPYATSVRWELPDRDGSATVNVQLVSDGWLGGLADTVVLDRVAPTASAISAAPRVGATLSGPAVPLALAWRPPTDRGAGLAPSPYRLEKSVNGGTWTSAGVHAGTSASVSAASSGKVRYRVRAVDAAGNAGPWAYTAALSPRLTQQSSTAVKYGGSWSTNTSAGYSGGSAKSATAAARSASYKFTGRAIALVATKAANRGKAKVYVNGVYEATVDLRASASQNLVLAWQKSWSTAASRTIRVVVVGTSGRPRVDVDAFVVVN